MIKNNWEAQRNVLSLTWHCNSGLEDSLAWLLAVSVEFHREAAQPSDGCSLVALEDAAFAAFCSRGAQRLSLA
jgi:hypothetical protein